ncbi:MAG TPA: haloacid dehalogenase type II [Candidatus Methylomirabilis sp.]|nr:haloacid dehalogenase type II [Candidatus Methylomirabilis sp.]HSD49985.1 haloacid dehalogenase type II [Candidatus Methylomirabilis sp.]
MPDIRAFVFDAYGTLFDVHSVVAACRQVTSDPETLSREWRSKQLEYTWLRALMGRYEEFWEVTRAALRFALRRLNLSATEAQMDRVMTAYLSLSAFPEVRETLETLHPRFTTAILSNGSPRMLQAAVESSGLTPYLHYVLSVDACQTYKPNPVVYALAPKALGVAKECIAFVSSNSFDVIGAKAFGFRVVWCNRTRAPLDELGFTPDVTVARLDEIPRALGLT